MRGQLLVPILVVCALGCRPCLQPVAEQQADSGVELVEPVLDAGTVDAGTVDAGMVDAGTVDAGTVDAGTVDAGTVDAGTVDAGTVDAGTVDAGARDAGVLNCPGPTYTTAPELARPRRANEWVELALIAATGDFMVSDSDYLRAERESSFVWDFRDAGIPVGFIPQYVPELIVGFDALGVAALQAGTYSAWDCLNQTYGGSVSSASSTSEWRYVSFRPLNLRTLALDYARLPNVRYAEPSGVGINAACGSASDLCIDPSPSGTWTWLALVEGPDCRDTYYRLTTEPDGGRTIEQWDAGQPPPNDWFEQAPRCAMDLWGHPWRYPDGGFVTWSPDGGQ